MSHRENETKVSKDEINLVHFKEFEALIPQLFDYFDHLKTIYKIDYPEIEDVPLYFNDEPTYYKRFIQQYKNDTLFDKEWRALRSSSFKDYLDFMRPQQLDEMDELPSFVPFMTIRDSNELNDMYIHCIEGNIWNMFRVYFLNKDKALEYFKVVLKHELGHVLYDFKLIREHGFDKARKIIFVEQKETDRAMSRWRNISPGSRLSFDEFYHTKCPTEAHANAMVGISWEDFKLY